MYIYSLVIDSAGFLTNLALISNYWLLLQSDPVRLDMSYFNYFFMKQWMINLIRWLLGWCGCFWEEPGYWGGAVCIMTRPQTEWLRNCGLIPGRARDLCVPHTMQTGCRANLALYLVVKEALRQEVRQPEHEAYWSSPPGLRLKMNGATLVHFLFVHNMHKDNFTFTIIFTPEKTSVCQSLLILWPISCELFSVINLEVSCHLILPLKFNSWTCMESLWKWFSILNLHTFHRL